jgi:hypothetical protein
MPVVDSNFFERYRTWQETKISVRNISYNWFLGSNLLAPVHPSVRVLAFERCRVEGANEHIVHRACKGAHQQLAQPRTSPAPPRMSFAPPATSHTHPIRNTRSIFVTSRHNSATYKRRQMKHLKQVSGTHPKTPEKHYKHIQHLDETLTNIRMERLKTLETYACNMHGIATSKSTFVTSR